MENEELLELTNETENADTQTAEKLEGGIELTDTSDANAEQKTEVKKTLREILDENPEYQEEFNGMIKGRLDRKDRQYQKELAKYKDTENVLRSTLNVADGEDVNQKLREAYKEQGVELPEAIKPGLSSGEIEALAQYEANNIISDGYEAMEEEANRLANIGYQNLNDKERIVFTTLAEKLTDEKNRRELLKLGAKESLLKDEDFIKFKNNFATNVPIETVYSYYKQLQPQKEVENPGSMKNTKSDVVKDIYTDEEISKLSLDDLDKPGVWEAVRKSMTS